MEKKASVHTHPVVILVGQLEACHKKLDNLLAVRGPVYSQLKQLELDHESLEEFFEFISIYSSSKKLIVGILKKYDPHVISALLKKIEDPPKEVDFIFLGNRFPRVFLTRGLVFRLHTSSEEITEQKALEEYIITALLEDKLGKVEIGYKTWQKILEVRKWMEMGQLTRENGIGMMRSLLEVAQIKLQNT